VIAGLVWQGAPYTATSVNPARSLGPALLAPLLGLYWVYVAGPLLVGALAVAAGFALLRDRRVLTAKLFHDPRYRSTLGTSLAVWAAAADRVGSEPASAEPVDGTSTSRRPPASLGRSRGGVLGLLAALCLPDTAAESALRVAVAPGGVLLPVHRVGMDTAGARRRLRPGRLRLPPRWSPHFAQPGIGV